VHKSIKRQPTNTNYKTPKTKGLPAAGEEKITHKKTTAQPL